VLNLQIAAHIAYHSNINDASLHHPEQLLGSISDQTYSILVWRIEVVFSICTR